MGLPGLEPGTDGLTYRIRFPVQLMLCGLDHIITYSIIRLGVALMASEDSPSGVACGLSNPLDCYV